MLATEVAPWCLMPTWLGNWLNGRLSDRLGARRLGDRLGDRRLHTGGSTRVN